QLCVIKLHRRTSLRKLLSGEIGRVDGSGSADTVWRNRIKSGADPKAEPPRAAILLRGKPLMRLFQPFCRLLRLRAGQKQNKLIRHDPGKMDLQLPRQPSGHKATVILKQ